MPEAYIRAVLNADVSGTFLSDVPKALADLGYTGKVSHFNEVNLGQVAERSGNGSALVLNVKAGGLHAVVVDFVKDGRAYIRDPWPLGTGSSYSVSMEELGSVLKGGAVSIGQ